MSTETFPTYLTDLVLKAFQKALSVDGINKLSQRPLLEIKLANENGENFCSTIYRVFVKNKTFEKHFIVKDMIQESNPESNEQLMYESVLPEMQKILNERLGPTCFLATDVPREVFILEDLNALGFRTANRQIGLDFKHAAILLRKIAKFHAVSMVFMKKFPNECDRLTLRPEDSQSNDDDTDDMGTGIVNKGLESAIQVVEKWNNFSAIATKMRKSMDQFDDKIKVLVDPANASIKVINHGDLWVNNFLYSYENDKPMEVVFVDYQNATLGSPGADLNYFLYTSVQLSLLKKQKNEFLQIYYDAFRTTLEHFNYDSIPSLVDLQNEVQRCAFFGYYAAVCELPLCCMSKEASAGFTQATFSDAAELARKHELMYDKCERVLETLRYVLVYFDELGVLD